MNEPVDSRGHGRPVHGPGRVVLEAFLVAVIGVALGLLANSLSPRGLSLTRNYFPSAARLAAPPRPGVSSPGASAANPVPEAASPAVTPTATAPATTAPATPAPPASEAGARVAQQLAEHGIGVLDREQALALFRDPRFLEERIVFIDARKAQKHAEGHIPGAYLFDHYYPQDHLPEVLPACQLAETVVVYCTGGQCEDSEFAAILLKEAGVPAERIRVYVAGIDDWKAAGLPIERGARGSGDLQESVQGPP